MDDQLVDIGEAADKLGFSRNSLKMYRYGSQNNFGRFDVGLPDADFMIGNKPVWKLSTLDAWCRDQKRGIYNPRHNSHICQE